MYIEMYLNSILTKSLLPICNVGSGYYTFTIRKLNVYLKPLKHMSAVHYRLYYVCIAAIFEMPKYIYIYIYIYNGVTYFLIMP